MSEDIVSAKPATPESALRDQVNQLRAHLDWVLEGLSMIESGEVADAPAEARSMIYASSHLSAFALSLSEALADAEDDNS